MNTQMIICMVIFAATLVSYMLNKIPMWLTAMISLAALYFTGCIDANGALAGFSNVNTLLMATMFVVAAGFRRTSVVDSLCNGIMKLTRGSFKTAYFGYILIAVLLTNFIASPMVVYAIVSPLLAALCDKTGHSRSQYMFPLMVVCVACCGILPLATAIQVAGQKMTMPILSTSGLSFSACLPDFFSSRASMGMIGCFGVNFGPRNSAQRGTTMRTGQTPMVKSMGRMTRHGFPAATT